MAQKKFLTGLETNTLKVTGGTPAASKVLTSDAGGNASWQTVDLYTAMSSKVTVIEDFLNGTTGSVVALYVSGTDAGGSIVNPTSPYEAGILRLTPGTTTSGVSLLRTSTLAISFYGDSTGQVQKCKVRCWPEQLSTSTQEFKLFVGFMNTSTITASTDGVFFHYDRTQSTNWLAIASNDGTLTTPIDTGVAVDITKFSNFEIIVTNMVATMYIDQVLVATISSGLPSGYLDSMGVITSIFKTAGTGLVYFQVDYMALDMDISR